MMHPLERSTTMLAAVVEKLGEPYRMRRISRPSSPQGQDILIKVLAASYCHTDAVFASGGLSQTLPRIGCHEIAGKILEVGPDVPKTRGIFAGLHVGVPGRAYHPCGTCYECKNTGCDEIGYSPYCPLAGNLGLTQDGGFQEFCLVDSRQVAPLPEGLSPLQAAPLMCAGLTIWSALRHDAVQRASTVGILGAGGGLGHLGVQFAARLGKKVLAIDANDVALAHLKQVKHSLCSAGTSVHVVDARTVDVDEAKGILEDSPAKLPTEMGLDTVILLPESQKAFGLGMQLLRNHGTMIVISFPKKKLSVSAHPWVFRDIRLVGSLVGRNTQLEEMLEFVVGNGVKASVKTYPFEQLNELVRDSKQGVSGKLVIDMTM
ncbi:PKS-ER domain-containing protein [Fusarium sp. LHS14.1]|nr:PKS-ER domain-containing protein [Fusarium sp. LHS14.1]